MIEESQKLPEGIRRLNTILLDNIDSEIAPIKTTLVTKRRNLTLISNKLQQKLEFTLGHNFTTQEKEEYFTHLETQKEEIEAQIEKVLYKKAALVRLFQSKYEAEKIGKLHSVEKLTQKLVGKILQE